MHKVAIVAALEREVRPLIKRWQITDSSVQGRSFRFFENANLVLVCGGIGSEAARRAAEAILSTYQPDRIYSVGFAGALDPTLKAGDVIKPERLIDAADGSRVQLEKGSGVLVSFGSIASPEQKAKLRECYAAQAVDMEAASVARAAEARGIRFGVVKAISDEAGFKFPAMMRFVDSEGKLSEWRFSLFICARPWLWLRIAKLARNSRRAARTLCVELRNLGSQESAAENQRIQAVR